MIYAQTKISLDMLMEQQNTKKMVEKMQEDIHKKCIDCRANVEEMAVQCNATPDRYRQMQKTLCIRCVLYPYGLTVEGGKT